MNKYLSLLIRLLLAAAGVAFICWSLTWRDHVILPAGYTAANFHVGSKPLNCDITARTDTTLTVKTPAGKLIHIPSASLDSTAQTASVPHPPRFRPGIFTTLGGADVTLLILGLLLTGLVFPSQALRWLILLRSRQLPVSYRKAFRLTMVGQFFNFCMPGTTGGDVMKAYYAAKNSGQRGAAIMSVLFDRIGGLLGMMLLGGMLGLTMLNRPMIRDLTIFIWCALALLFALAAVYFSGRIRRALWLDRLIDKLPSGGLMQRIDQAAVAFRDQPRAVLLTVLISLPIQVCLMSATGVAGLALGMHHSLLVLITVLPVVFVAGSVPLTYQGLGIMEGLAIALLVAPDLASANQVVGMLLLLRLFMIFYALVGSLVLLRGDIHLFPADENIQQSIPAPAEQPAPSQA